MRSFRVVLVTLLCSVTGWSAPRKKTPPVAPTVEAPRPAAPLPPPKRTALEAQELTPLPVLPPAPVAVVVEAAPESAGPSSFLHVEAAGGLIAPLSSLGPGGRADLRAVMELGSLPLRASLGVAFEQHTFKTTAMLAPPAGGLEVAVLDNQTLLPLEVVLRLALVHDTHQRLDLGAGYGLLLVWAQTSALGTTQLERGVGHDLLGELSYARRLGPVELLARVRYSVRKTGVGRVSSTAELPWYQSLGVLVGVAL